MDTMAVVVGHEAAMRKGVIATNAGSPQVRDVSLERVTSYRHGGVVERLMKNEGWSKEVAEAVFLDMLRFLWLTSSHRGYFSPPPRIDEAWHTMILFTKDYASFCEQYIGEFIHHQPFAGGLEPKADPITNRYPLANTLEVAKAVFGDLSDSWAVQGVFLAEPGGDCDKCEGSTNCQDGANACQ